MSLLWVQLFAYDVHVQYVLKDVQKQVALIL